MLRRFKFSLRSLLFLMLLLAVAVVYLRSTAAKLLRQKQAVAALTKSSNSLRFEHRPFEPKWLAQCLSLLIEKEDLNKVVTVHGRYCFPSDEALRPVKDLPYLERLYIASNPITVDGLKHLADLKRLKRISLWKTNITDEGLKSLGQLRELEKLDIARATTDYSESQLTQASLVPFRGHPNLRELLFSFPVDESGVEILSSMPKLRLKRLRLKQPTDNALNQVTRWKRISSLEIMDGGDYQDLGMLDALPQLTELSLSGNIYNRHLNGIDKLTKVQHLDLQDTKVTNAIAPKLARMESLAQVSLWNTQVTCEVFESFRGTNRELAVLANCPVNDQGVRAMSEMNGAYARDFYVSDVGLRQLAKLRLNNIAIFDAAAGKGLVDTTDEYLSDDAFLDYVVDLNQHQVLNITAKNVTFGFLRDVDIEGKYLSVLMNSDVLREKGLFAMFPEKLKSVSKLRMDGNELWLSGGHGISNQMYLRLPAQDTRFDLAVLKALPELHHIELGRTASREWMETWGQLNYADELKPLVKLENGEFSIQRSTILELMKLVD